MKALPLVQDAERAVADGKFEEALQLWTKLALEKKKAAYYCLAGAMAQKLGRWNDAEHAFREARAVDSKDPSVIEGLGSLYLRRKDGDRDQTLAQARDCFLAALAIERQARTLTSLGVAYLALEQIQEARNAFEEALRLDNNYEEALYNLAIIEKQVDVPQAITLLERALEIDPNYSIAHQELGELYQSSGDFVRAEHHFRRHLDTDPTGYWPHVFLANLLAVQGKNTEAEKLFRVATSLRPENNAGIEAFAEFLISIGKHDEAAALRKRSTGGLAS